MSPFNESEWLKLLFLLSDMQQWMADTEKDLFMKVPGSDKKKFFRRTFYITASAFAHILERHYYKLQRHPETGKFTVPVPDILQAIRSAAHCTELSVPGCLSVYRESDTGQTIGYDRFGTSTTFLTVITDRGGCIKTAFPGLLKNNPVFTTG